MREPTWDEVDGVPVVWAELPGPLRAVLHFRVGVAHESAATHGISHLVEHLALHGTHERPYSLNGVTSLTRTSFLAMGEPAEVVEFVGSVATALRALPAERVEVERRVLLAEGDRRSTSYRDGLMFWRFGAQAHGLVGLEELGLRWLDAATAQRWADERFTRQNALLVLSGPPPRGLRIPLADGPVNPPVLATPVETVIPGWAPAGAAGIGAAGVVPRATGITVAMGVLVTELNRVLRFDRGLTYGVEGSYEPLDAEQAHFTVSADAAEADRPALRDGFLEVLERLAREGPGEEAVQRGRAAAARVDEDERVAGALELISMAHATGRAYEPYDAVLDGIANLTHDDATDLVRAFARSVLFVVPNGVDLPEPRYPRLPWWSDAAVQGVTFAAAEGDARLVVGDTGISVFVEEKPVTVRWNDVVATMEWDDGASSFLGYDGHRVTFVPWEWHRGAEARQRIANLAPRRGPVPMGPESPWGPPPPPKEPPLAPPAHPQVRSSLWWILVALGALLGLAQLAVAADGPQPATATSEAFTSADVLAVAVMGTLITSASIWGAVVLRRGRRR